MYFLVFDYVVWLTTADIELYGLSRYIWIFNSLILQYRGSKQGSEWFATSQTTRKFGHSGCVCGEVVITKFFATPTLHWRPDDRLTEGYPDSVLCVFLLALCIRRWGGLCSSSWTWAEVKLDRLGDRGWSGGNSSPGQTWGLIEWNFFTRSRVELGALPESPVSKGDSWSASILTT